MDFAIDFPAMARDFGTDAALDGAAVRGIFDDVSQQAFGVIGGSALLFIAKTSDIPADPRGLPLVIDGTSYTVVDVESAGAGVSTLKLESA